MAPPVRTTFSADFESRVTFPTARSSNSHQPTKEKRGAIGGYLVLEADDEAAAIALAASISAARHGGAVEVRPVEKYW